MTIERRQSQRAHVLRRAKIVFRRGHGAMDCVVLDLSKGGARLRLGSWLGIPDRFELRIENGPTHEAEVRFRAPELAGVRFVEQVA